MKFYSIPLPFRALFLLLVFIVTALPLIGQQANHWPLYGYELNFSDNEVTVTKEYAEHLNRGMGVMSDQAGNLLMYTDGYSIFNRNHVLMPNGGSLIPFHLQHSSQESLIVPKPGDNSRYFIFTTDAWNGQATSGLYVAEVNMALDGGFGDVVNKRVKLVDNTSNKLSAVFHANGKDVWVATMRANSDKILILRVTEQGISNTILEQGSAGIDYNWAGQMKFSPDGKRLAVSYSGSAGAGVTLFDFDKSQGMLSNAMDLSFADIENPTLSGLEFSSDATRLYTFDLYAGNVYQFDVSSNDFAQIKFSRKRVYGPIVYNRFRQFQLASNGKIYLTKGGGGGSTSHLGVIDNPNADWQNVVILEKGLFLEGNNSFDDFTPNFIQDYFYKTDFTSTGHCQGSTIGLTVSNLYQVDSVLWNFGDGRSSKLISPTLTYNTPGNYEITLIAYYKGQPHTIRQKLTIDPITSFELGNNTSLCSGERLSLNEKFADYLWNTGDTTNYIRIRNDGVYQLTTTNSYGCTYTDSVYIQVIELPIINLPDSIQMGASNSVELVPGDFESYSWNTGEVAAKISVSEEGWYSVSVKNTDGCSAAKSVYVSRQPQAIIQESGWKMVNPLPSIHNGNDIFFLDECNGFLVNGQELIRTRDQGNSWEVQMKLSFGKRISFKAGIGYVVGDYGTVYRSTHNGDGWNKMNFPNTDHLNAISILHPDTIHITSDSRVYSSKNGGKTWTSVTVGDFNIEDSYFTDSKTGHIACKNGRIMKTTDGGATWKTTLITNTSPSDFFRITFVNGEVGFASAEHFDLYKTIDAGEHWIKVGNSTDPAYAIQFLNEDTGFMAGKHGAINKTTDGGQTWNEIGYDIRKLENDMHSVFFVNENQGYATGLNGRIVRTFDGGKTWQQFSSDYWDIRHVELTMPQLGYFLSYNEIFATDNGGESWINLGAPLPTKKTVAFDFVNNLVGYAIVGGDLNSSAYSGMVYKTINGGTSWAKAHISDQILATDLNTIYFINEAVGFVSSDYVRVVLKTMDGGKSWTNVFPDSFGQIQFLNEQVGYAHNVNNSVKRLYKTTDGGTTWTVVFENDKDINAFHFLSQTHGFLVGDSGMMYYTEDGGDLWKKLDPPAGYYSDVKFLNNKYGYLLDDYYKLYLTRDGGKTWKTDELSDYGMLSLSIADNIIFASGRNGQVYRNSIEARDLVLLDALTLQVLTDSTASFDSKISSSMDLVSAPIFAEIRTENAEYTGLSLYKEYNGFVNEMISHTYRNLEASTKYYCRLKLLVGDKVIVSPEYILTTPAKVITPPVITAIETEDYKKAFQIYPNPTRDQIEIVAVNPDYSFTYECSNLTGHLLFTGSGCGRTSLKTNELQPGIYVLIIKSQEGIIRTRIIKE